MSRHQKGWPERLQKRSIVGHGAANLGSSQLSSVEDIQRGVRNVDESNVGEVLTAIRNKFSVKPADVISPQDERLLLAKEWMDASPGAQDIFQIWENINQHQMNNLALPVSLLSSILVLLSSHFTNHSHGLPIIKTLLSPSWMRRLTSYLGGSHNELILVTVRLLNAISDFGGGRERKSLLDIFPWELKTLPKLLFLRRRTKNDDQADILSRPDIRTWYILFVLSFVGLHTPTTVKTSFLEQHRDAFLGIFKGLVQDSYSVVRKVLEVSWGGLWSDPKIKRTLKIGLFNETIISHLLRLYDRVNPEVAGSDSVPADLVHHFLLAICTRPGTGICFKDKGWYPRESDANAAEAEEESGARKGGKIYNKILSNVLKNLKVNEDSRQQELALKIMLSCPELVAGYWSSAGLTLEPRLSSRWIANIAFFGNVLSQPVPVSSFMLPDSTLYHPSPPPLYNILENVLPTVNTKQHLSKGLKSTSYLVQHCTALALAKCLMKYAEVLRLFREVETVLEEDGEDGQWSKRRRDLEKEVRRRVPEFQVIIAFSQQKYTAGPPKDGSTSDSAHTSPKVAFLTESAQRLLWLYHHCLPSLVAEARFDVGKLLQEFADNAGTASLLDTDTGVQNTFVLRAVKQLHVLRMLKESDQFVWSGKMASTSHSYLHVLLKSYTLTRTHALRDALRTLLRKILSESIMFQQDPNEVDLWLISLPSTERSLDAKSPDGAPLTDERDGVITFLDDCVQRFLKTPYRYYENMQEFTQLNRGEVSTGSTSGYQDESLSPLLIVIFEQLGAKVNGKLLSPSDALAIVTFVRKLLFRLSQKQQDPSLIRKATEKVDAILHPDNLFTDYPIITSAIRFEVSIIHFCAHQFEETSSPETESGTTAQTILHEIEQSPVPSSLSSRITAASRLIDLVRLARPHLKASDVSQISMAIERLHSPALREFFQTLHPASTLLWKGADVLARRKGSFEHLEFCWLFVQSRPEELASSQCHDTLVDFLFYHSPSHLEVERAICIVVHGISSSKGEGRLGSDLLLLAASIMKKASVALQGSEWSTLKEYVFTRLQAVRDLCFSHKLLDPVELGLVRLVDATLDPLSDMDRKLVVDISAYWDEVFKVTVTSEEQEYPTLIKLWIRYREPEDLFNLLQYIGGTAGQTSHPFVLEVLQVIIASLKSRADYSLGQVPVKDQVTQLLALRPMLPDSVGLENMIASAIAWHLPLCHDGLSLPPEILSESRVESLSSWSDVRWKGHSQVAPLDVISDFLHQKRWSSHTPKIISAFLYTHYTARKAFSTWLTTDTCAALSNEHLASVLHAYLDSAGPKGTEDLDDEMLKVVIRRLLPQKGYSEQLKLVCCRCITLLVCQHPSKSPDILSLLQQTVFSSPSGYHAPDIMAIIAGLLAADIKLGDVVVEALDRSLQWVVRYLSDHESLDDEGCGHLDLLKKLLKSQSNVKAYLAEPVLTVIVQNHLSDADALDLGIALVQSTLLKPATVNKFLQSILHHPRFFKLTCSEAPNNASKGPIIELLYALFILHPTNTCQPSHVEPLIQLYRGTLSRSDVVLLSIFKLFENQRKIPVSSILSNWSASGDPAGSSTSLHAIQSLEPIQMLRTCLGYPTWRGFADDIDVEKFYETLMDDQIYDPLFVISLFGHMLSQNPPTSALAWVEVFRTNVVSLLIRSLSSNDTGIREASLCQIAGLWRCLEPVDMLEKSQVMHILNLLKDTLPSNPNEPPTRLPSYTSLILLHALRGIFYPTNFIYPMTARFLLQRPELDVTDVPMLYGMLYSSSDDWKKERGWIIRFLSDGMMSTDDWRVLKRRHTWDLLASLFQSSEKDQTLRHGVLEVLANITCNRQATTSLILKSSLLVWIEMQLVLCRAKESLEWVKILENILITVNTSRLESTTNGEWRFVTSRCLLLLLEDSAFESTLSLLSSAVSVVLRLSALPGKPNPHLPALISKATQCLKKLETTITYDQDTGKITSSSKNIHKFALPPHRSRRLHDPPPVDSALEAWGRIVEELWQASMSLEKTSSAWNTLTSRLLLWRSVVGEERSQVGEWARREVVCNLQRWDTV